MAISKPLCFVSVAHADVEDDTDMSEVVSETNVNDADIQHKEYHVKLQNSDVLSNLDQRLGHLEEIKQTEISKIFFLMRQSKQMLHIMTLTLVRQTISNSIRIESIH